MSAYELAQLNIADNVERERFDAIGPRLAISCRRSAMIARVMLESATS